MVLTVVTRFYKGYGIFFTSQNYACGVNKQTEKDSKCMASLFCRILFTRFPGRRK